MHIDGGCVQFRPIRFRGGGCEQRCPGEDVLRWITTSGIVRDVVNQYRSSLCSVAFPELEAMNTVVRPKEQTIVMRSKAENLGAENSWGQISHNRRSA